MQINRRHLVLGAAATTGLSTLGSRRVFAADRIRIGAILPLSGTAELVGTKQRIGIEIARDQINAAGGVLGRQIEIVFGDDKGDPNQTIARAREMTGSGVNLIIGPSLTALSIALTGVIQSLDAVMMTPSSPFDPLTHELFNRNFFRLADNNFTRNRALARAMAQNFPNVTVWGGMISDFSVGHDSWKQFTAGLKEFYPQYAKKDVTILDVTTAKFGTTDYKTQIFRLLQSPAQGVLSVMIGADMITMWKQAKTLGLSDKLEVVVDAGGELDLPIILGRDMPKNVWSVLHWYFGNTNPNKANQDLVAEILKRTGDKTPSSLTGPAYGAVFSYAAAIKAANSTKTADVVNALENVKVLTPKGEIYFRKEDHQQVGPVSILGSVPGPDGANLKTYFEIPAGEIIDPPTPGVQLKI
ncbi:MULTISPECIES: ABC transporter substrate-binding protein [unclassified Chelatococcus]|uniref:ABC transporter substrate-binding protein n=1 Tax=unclassified Chelatococcus TaxID=2638111 RepID=UPI001BCF26EC|nr:MULTISPECIES: ABC transporter substrate-binding protein [unclassified Chelatococcus]MBS7743436.1 ABC transporter substrate-binding protein [Chelatococcus sp. HY11]MBX3547187.1 ABC transporter substrate-binding protein [Chelatococcus sp.]